MSAIKLALIQMRSGTDPERNLDDAEALIREAAASGAKFVLTPETTTLVQKDAERLFDQIHTPDVEPAIVRFADLADSLGIDLLIGSMALKGGAKSDDGRDRAVNRSHLFGPDGALKVGYDKIHMFDVALGGGETYSESTNYAPGDRAVLTEAAGGKLGLTICYDVRFAGLYRRLAQAGAQMISVPSAFTRPTGRAHWETLLRARAIETGSFILAPAQGGKHEDGRKTWGHSMVIGPWGEIIAHLDHDEPGVLHAEIDLDEVASARSRIPSLSNDREFTGP
ncbi:carbon-nitrogen hydrolase family protein [Oceanicaulis sp. UBA2681]|uniref:carbon-nitrogen hydrolase family protein n=1 Tax=Oceanicaulis sp. UBA2681 TaxID=1947007 RepID=UPI000ED6F9B9|nr:carbon-nitrogen hydrolase family protein [Oceanicaulis sp. UBA2681]HCR66448.1 amidohydrolase [Oceanicaulis sp.]|tara:strand:+ start:17845 stop:18687 length:843 start_codon:yes stop_codon:yes gene_type:complete